MHRAISILILVLLSQAAVAAKSEPNVGIGTDAANSALHIAADQPGPGLDEIELEITPCWEGVPSPYVLPCNEADKKIFGQWYLKNNDREYVTIYNPEPMLPEHHVVTIENTRATTDNSDESRTNTAGLAVVLHSYGNQIDPAHNNQLNSGDNFVTFFHDTGAGTQIAGRIEGVSLQDIVSTEKRLIQKLDNFHVGQLFEIDLGYDPDWLSFTAPRLEANTDQWRVVEGNSGCDGDGAKYIELCAGLLFDLNVCYATPSLDPGGLAIGNPFPRSPQVVFNEETALELGQDLASIGGLSASIYKKWKDPVGYAIQFPKASFKAGVTFASGSGDYEEWLEHKYVNEKLEIGDVVGLFGGKVSRQTKGADHLLAISYKPIVLGNMPSEVEYYDSTKWPLWARRRSS